jgi:hypothetical protein
VRRKVERVKAGRSVGRLAAARAAKPVIAESLIAKPTLVESEGSIVGTRARDESTVAARARAGRVERCGASDGADGSESSSWPNSASSRGAIEGVDCGRIGGRCAFGIFSREEPLRHSRLHSGLDPLLNNFVQFLAQIGDGVQTGEMEGLDGSFGRSDEIFERPVDGVLSQRRVLLCIPLGARHCRKRYHTRYYRIEY